MTLRLALLVLLVAASPAQAWLVQKPASTATVQVLTAISSGTVSGTAARNMSFTFDSAATATTGVFLTTFPFAGTFSNLRFEVGGGVTGAQTWQGEIVKNGSTNVIGCTVNSSTNPCLQSSSGSVASGDTAILVVTPSGTPTNAILKVTVDFTPTHAGDTILSTGNATAFSTSAIQGVSLSSGFPPGTIATRSVNLLAEAGTLDLLTVATNAPGTGSMQYAYDVAKNGTASGLFTCDIVATATSCQDSTTTLSNADGDAVAYAASPSNTPTNGALGGYSARWTPTTLGDFPFVATGLYTTNSATLTTYWSLSGTGNTTESSADSLVNNMTITKLEVKLPLGAPGAGKSRVFTLDDNTTPTALTCTISGSSTTSCTATGSISIAAGDHVDVSDVPSGSPSAVHPEIGLIAHR